MVFPAVQSVLDNVALARELAARYRLAVPVRCGLVVRGMNDIYRVDTGTADKPGPRYALKVARARKASDAEFGYEQDYVAHLDRSGFAVPGPVPLTTGALFFTVAAPEGPRQVALMRWLEGRAYTKNMVADEAHRLGGLLARIHLAAKSFRHPVSRMVDGDGKLRERLPALLDLFRRDADAKSFLSRAADTVAKRVAALDLAAVPRGPVHGDFQFNNMLMAADGRVAVFDFSDCGEDFLARDVAAFFWGADYDGVGDPLNGAFVAGYEAVRPLGAAERAALPLFRAARHLLSAASLASYMDRLGPRPGFENNLRYYLSMIRLYCAEAGVL